MVGHAQLTAGVPAHPSRVQDKHDLLLGAGADGLGEGGQLDLEKRNAVRGGELEERAPQGRRHLANEGAPGEAILDDGRRLLADRRPDRAEEGLEPDAMLIRGPQLDVRLWVGRGHRADERAQFF